MMTHFTPKNAVYAECLKCDFKCFKKSDWSRHILTRKHKNDDDDDANDDTTSVQKTPFTPKKSKHYPCECGKKYAYRQGLNLHKKKCKFIHDNASIENNTLEKENNLKVDIKNNDSFNEKEIILSLLNQNNMLQNQILDMCKERTNTCINNGNINYNKTFNLNIFLNEQCKDAMNIMEFVESLKLQISDLESVGKLGFVEGISNIIVRNLKALDVHKRPLHCSDMKREILYIKDEDKWEKENQDKKKLKKAIKYIAHKNTKMISEFKAKYPDCIYSASKKSDQYNKLIIEAMGGLGNEDEDNENKIIKKIAKEVVINKQD
jgi:hypothetical protein